MHHECRYCCQALDNPASSWCPACGSRLQPLSLLPTVQMFARLGARFLDLCLFESIMAMVSLPLLWLDPGNAILMVYVKLAHFIGLFTLLPFLESWCLARWGSTPGKWLMRLEVVGPGGILPSWQQAACRTRKLYHQLGYFMAALGMFAMLVMAVLRQETGVTCMLIVTGLILVICHGQAWRHYRKSGGHTVWDETQGLRVNHRVLRFERVMVALLSYFLLSAATQIVNHWPEVAGQSHTVL